MKYCDYYKNNNININFNIDFYNWMDAVEYIVFNKLKINLLDLPDQMYMHYFEENVSSIDMVDIIFEDLLLDLSSDEDDDEDDEKINKN